MADVRDGALLLLGSRRRCGGPSWSRSTSRDLTFVAGGVRVTVRQSKVDQEGHGAVVGVPNGERPDTCPVRWLQRWLATSGIEEGPRWRGGNRAFPPDDDAERRFAERVVDDTVWGLRVDGRQVEPFDSWLARRRPWWWRWLARIRRR